MRVLKYSCPSLSIEDNPASLGERSQNEKKTLIWEGVAAVYLARLLKAFPNETFSFF